MKRFDKILIALILTWPLQAATPMIIRYLGSMVMPEDSRNPAAIYGLVATLTVLLTRAVFGYWLYFASKNEKGENKWLWCAVGLSGGIYGVLVFYPYLILKEIRARNEQLQPSSLL